MTLTQRILLKLLWLKKSYTFLWAHKPLCKSYEEDVIRVCSIYLCRSCTLLYFGLAMSLIISLFWNEVLSPHGGIICVLMSLFVLPLSAPGIYKKFGRRVRDLLRFMLGAVMGFLPYLIFSGKFLLVFVLAVTSLFLWYFYSRHRSRRKISECEECPKYSEGKICEGYELQADLVRQYEIEADSYLESSGYVPASLRNRVD